MISSLKLVQFQDIAECRSNNFQSRESFLPITYEFKPHNVYGLVSDFGCGSWGLATCVSGRVSENYYGKVFLNGTEITPSELLRYSCFVAENTYSGIDLVKEISSPREYIEKAVSISGCSYSVSQIKALFCLSDERFERPLATASREIWLISMAINFALGKQIFCYPWLNEMDISRFEIAYNHGIIKTVKDLGGIVLVPSSQKKILKKHCDYSILFNRKGYI